MIMIFITVPGNWGTWDNWSVCSLKCGGGTKSRSRSCNDPIPQNEGANCPSNVRLLEEFPNGIQKESENQTCNVQDCPSKYCDSSY